MITLLPIGPELLDALDRDPTVLAGHPVVEGALPPRVVVVRARGAMARGVPARFVCPWAFVHDPTGQVVGAGGPKGPPIRGSIEIGYGVAPSCRRQGHATAAVRRMTDLLLDDPEITEVRAHVHPHNTPSIRALQAAGFRLRGHTDEADGSEVEVWFARSRPEGG